MKNQVLQMTLNQLRMKNPQMYQMLSQGKINPLDILKQMAGNSTPEQMQHLFSQAQNLGCPNEILAEIQNQLGMNSK